MKHWTNSTVQVHFLGLNDTVECHFHLYLNYDTSIRGATGPQGLRHIENDTHKNDDHIRFTDIRTSDKGEVQAETKSSRHQWANVHTFSSRNTDTSWRGFRGVQFRWQSPHNEKLEPSETTSFATNASPRKGQVHQTDSYQRLSLPPTQCNCHLPLSKLLSTKTAKRWHRSTIVSCYTQNEGKKENMEKYTIRGNFYNFFFSLLCRFIDRAFFLAFRLVSSKSWHCVVTVPNDMHRGTFFFPEALRLEPARTLRCQRNASIRSMQTFCIAKGAWASQTHCLPIGPVNSSWPACLRMSCQLGGQTWREIAWRDREQHFDTLFRRLHLNSPPYFPANWRLESIWASTLAVQAVWYLLSSF